LLVEGIAPPLGIADRSDIVLCDDLLRRIGEPQARKPAPVGAGPGCLAVLDAAVPQQKPRSIAGVVCDPNRIERFFNRLKNSRRVATR